MRDKELPWIDIKKKPIIASGGNGGKEGYSSSAWVIVWDSKAGYNVAFYSFHSNRWVTVEPNTLKLESVTHYLPLTKPSKN